MGTRVCHGPLLKNTILYSDFIVLVLLASILGYFTALRLQLFEVTELKIFPGGEGGRACPQTPLVSACEKHAGAHLHPRDLYLELVPPPFQKS